MTDQTRSEMQLAEAFKALGHPVRLQLLQRIISGEYCVGKLQATVAQSQSSVSQHLGVLRSRGLIEPVRKGQRTCYRVRDPRLATLLEEAREILID